MNKAPLHSIDVLNDYLYNGAGEAAQFIVYAPKISKRLRYVCDFIFHQSLICNYTLTDQETEFVNSNLCKINYSDKAIPGAFQIVPMGLLDQIGVKEFVPSVKTENNRIVFFPTEQGDFPADVFSAVFFFISRYEEWQKVVKDGHGRFEILNSILHKLAATKIPVVDCWMNELKAKLQQTFPALKLKQRPFKYISSIDVDNVYAFKAKPLYRNLGGALKDVLSGNLKMFSARMGTVCFGKKDPFDAYDQQVALSKQYKIPLIYFFLYRNNTEFDRTIKPGHPLFVALLQKLNTQAVSYGLHPSYFTSDSEELLNKEVKAFAKDSGKAVLCSRQHYLRFNIRTTPLQLQNAGIKFDFSMGFASAAGFRAGTGLPFYYYDLNSENVLDIMAVPFAVIVLLLLNSVV